MQGKQSHILIIDDNIDILYILRIMLRHAGYIVSVKENINQLGSFIKEISPGIILMDMLLSGADGREVCRLLQADPSFSRLAVIVFSAQPGAREECRAAGATSFLEKPFEMKDLVASILSSLPN